jgi:hypothetical protein
MEKSSSLHCRMTRSRRTFRVENIQQRPLCFWLVMLLVWTRTEKSICNLAAAAGTKAASGRAVREMALDITCSSGRAA